jgi:hypothetical protein
MRATLNAMLGRHRAEQPRLSEHGEERRKRLGVCQMCMGAEELQLAGRVCRRKLREHQPAEQRLMRSNRFVAGESWIRTITGLSSSR